MERTSCRMNLANFPNGCTKLSLVIGKLIRLVFFFSVRHTVEEMDFRWKEDEPITIFNEELAEFDVVKFDVESKNESYVSG